MLGGYRLHDADTPVSLDVVLACVQGVALSDAVPSVASDLLSSPARMLQTMQERIGIQQHFFLNGGGFDDFLKLFFKDRENTYLHWALHPQVAHLSIYGDYPKGVQRLVVGNLELQSVVDQFAKELEAAKARPMPPSVHARWRSGLDRTKAQGLCVAFGPSPRTLHQQRYDRCSEHGAALAN